MQVLLLPIGRGFTGHCLDIGAWDLAEAIGGRVPDAVVTFALGQEASGAWQEVKGEAMSVNVICLKNIFQIIGLTFICADRAPCNKGSSAVLVE